MLVSFSVAVCIDKVVDVFANCQECQSDVHFLQPCIFWIVKEHVIVSQELFLMCTSG